MLRRQAWPLAPNDAPNGRGTDRWRWALALSADPVCSVKIAALVLAAGASRRLGRPKQNVVLAGQTLLHRTVTTAQEAGLDPIIVVARQASEYSALAAAPGIIITVNQN